jgi:undecaprenyl-diphosphatase
LVAAALVAAIGLSRIYLGVHYPSDVVAGYLAGAVWIAALIAADRVRTRRRLRAEANAPEVSPSAASRNPP